MGVEGRVADTGAVQSDRLDALEDIVEALEDHARALGDLARQVRDFISAQGR